MNGSRTHFKTGQRSFDLVQQAILRGEKEQACDTGEHLKKSYSQNLTSKRVGVLNLQPTIAAYFRILLMHLVRTT
eukprot:637742-Amphidinium_carterae.1